MASSTVAARFAPNSPMMQRDEVEVGDLDRRPELAKQEIRGSSAADTGPKNTPGRKTHVVI